HGQSMWRVQLPDGASLSTQGDTGTFDAAGLAPTPLTDGIMVVADNAVYKYGSGPASAGPTTPSATPAPTVDPLTAWIEVTRALPTSTATSSIGVGSAGLVALAVDDENATVWAYSANHWNPTETIDVSKDTVTGYPPTITVADVTGD